MIGFLIGLVLFVITIPLRSAILILKGSIKTTELIAFKRFKNRQKNEGKESDALDSTLNKNKNTRESMTPAELALYTAQKLALRGLKTALAIIQWIGRLITLISVLIMLVMILFIACIIACVGAIIAFIMGGGISSGGVADGITDAKTECKNNVEDYMNACQSVWDDWRSKGYDYSQATGTDPDFGTFRPDCSGYVYATLQEAGILPKPTEGSVFFTGNMGGVIMETGQFDELVWTSQADLKAGDIVVQPGSHTQVYMGNDTWFNNGSEGKIPGKDKPWNDGGYFANKMNSLGGKVYRLKPVECKDDSGEDVDWDCPEGGLPIPHYLQYTYDCPIGNVSNIASGGCGYTSLAMVLSYLKNEKIEPDDIIAKVGSSFHVAGAGISWGAFTGIPEIYGITGITESFDSNTVLTALKEGHPVICSQGPGLFTKAGHIIVLRGITKDGKVLINDPNDNDRKNYISREFDFETEVKSTARNFWIFPKKGE